MKCQSCESGRVLSVGSHGVDCQYWRMLDFPNMNGYLPIDFGIGGGDNMRFSYCLNCGQIQGKFPLPLTEYENESGNE